MEDMKQRIQPHYTTVMPCRWGWFCGLSLDKYQTYSMMVQGEWGHEEAEILSQFIVPGDTVIDVGANVGSLTLALAAMVGNSGAVYAIEPQRFAFGCLWANIAMNSLVHIVTPLQVAVGDKSGVICVPSFGLTEETYNAGGMSLRGDGVFKELFPEFAKGETGDRVPLIRIDDLGLERLDLIKADVEGMEPAVLRGAKATIEKCRPVIWCEDLEGTYPNTTAELSDVFRSNNYKAWKIRTPVFSQRNTRLNTTNLWEGQADQNVLALPAEDKHPEWVSRAEPFPL